MTTERTPAEVRCNVELGPDERAKLDALLDHIHEHGTTSEGVLRLAAQLCQAARADERERCAKVCQETAARYLRGNFGEAAGACTHLASRISGER